MPYGDHAGEHTDTSLLHAGAGTTTWMVCGLRPFLLTRRSALGCILVDEQLAMAMGALYYLFAVSQTPREVGNSVVPRHREGNDWPRGAALRVEVVLVLPGGGGGTRLGSSRRGCCACLGGMSELEQDERVQEPEDGAILVQEILQTDGRGK